MEEKKREPNPDHPSRYAGKPGSVRSPVMNYPKDKKVFTERDVPARALQNKLETIEIKLRNRENRKQEWNISTEPPPPMDDKASMRTLSKGFYLDQKVVKEREKMELEKKKRPVGWNISSYFTEKEKDIHRDQKLEKSLKHTKRVINSDLCKTAPTLVERERMKQEAMKQQQLEASRVTMRDHFLNSPPITLGLTRRLLGDNMVKEDYETVYVEDIIHRDEEEL